MIRKFVEAKENKKDEVIIWDASDNDSSKIVVEQFVSSHPNMMVRYFKAPRAGLPSQRNDAVKVAKGEIVFFIDDDSEVSKDGLRALVKEFEVSDIDGAGLPLMFSIKKDIKTKIRKIYFRFFRLPNSASSRRKVYLSGWNTMSPYDKPGKVEWLSGCSMAYKKSIFTQFNFQEKLEKFGGYALGEDVYFSYMLFKNGYALKILSNGYVIYHVAERGRLESEKKAAAMFYNQFLIWRNVIFPHNFFSVFVYLWSVFGEIIFYSLTGIKKRKE